jgi:benzoyl-CoA reductase/2-hydroxyglutaryl-CoA dehydratase subunit BcrC/BadD/HgdB
MTAAEGHLAWFDNMVDNCLAYAQEQKAQGRKIVGITCEYTPRELIIAAGGVPVCLCGGSLATIAAAEQFLPTNLCPLIKSTFGFSLERANPFLEMADLVVAETTCDGKKKMFELLADSRPMYVLELPQKADDADALRHWVREVAKLRAALTERFGTSITDDGLRTAIAAVNRERAFRRRLAALMKSAEPPLTGRELLDMKSLVSCMPRDEEHYEAALRTLPSRRLAGRTRPAVRVLLTGVPVPHGAEKVVDIIESSGGLVVCQENCTGLKPLLEDVDASTNDPLRAIAERYFHLPCSVMTRNIRRLESLRDLTREFRADCVVDLIWQTCVTYDVESYYVRKLCEEELGLPYLRIESDYSPSDTARLAMRVQALFETVRAVPRSDALRASVRE